jgi:plasmid stability protein
MISEVSRPRYPSEMKESFIVRLPDGIRSKVKEAAAKNHRSMNSEFIFLIEKGMMQEKQSAAQ